VREDNCPFRSAVIFGKKLSALLVRASFWFFRVDNRSVGLPLLNLTGKMLRLNGSPFLDVVDRAVMQVRGSAVTEKGSREKI
jgi:hypothetical protein